MPRRQKQKLFPFKTVRWALLVAGWSFVLSLVLSLAADTVMDSLGIVASFLILLFFILLGIFFDILGLATATVSPKPFRSMASHRVYGAKQALRLIASAEKVSSFCNDVVGDIAGIISGATCTAIAGVLVRDFRFQELPTILIISALVASVTVGVKALGKTLAIAKSKEIVYHMARVIAFFEREKDHHVAKHQRRSSR